jgi:hypothetical protein
MSFPCLNYVFSFAGMNEGNCDDNHNQTVAVPIQSVKTARPSFHTFTCYFNQISLHFLYLTTLVP